MGTVENVGDAGMKRHSVILAAAICIGTAPSAASAHHSHPYFYDQCKSITIEGRVERVEFKDPHTWIVLRLEDGRAYTVDWNGLSALTRTRIIDSAKGALVSGARVAVTGNPIRNAAQIREHFPDFTDDLNPNTVDPKSIRRVDDSFDWAMRQSANPADCSRK
jgi:hypothetical protein